MMAKSLFITLILCITFCCALRPQFVFYTETECVGDGLILGSKQPDLASFAPGIILTSQSVSTTGFWGIYPSINYSETPHRYDGWVCSNFTSQRIAKSARYLGPQDTTTPSISLYELGHFGGIEVTITGPASNNFPFTPRSLFTTQHTSWTLYSGNDFDGTATCFIPRTDLWYHRLDTLNSTLSNVRSVLRGCNRHIDYYIYGSSQQPEDTLTAHQ